MNSIPVGSIDMTNPLLSPFVHDKSMITFHSTHSLTFHYFDYCMVSTFNLGTNNCYFLFLFLFLLFFFSFLSKQKRKIGMVLGSFFFFLILQLIAVSGCS